MMTEGSAYHADPARVVHETLDGETILIALSTGAYYSLTGSGPAVWSALSQGATLESCVAALVQHFPDVDAAQLTKDAAALGEQLLAEELLSESGTPTGDVVALTDVANTYEPPVLQRYDDMEYLLLLDPVHEAHDNGWPQMSSSPAE